MSLPITLHVDVSGDAGALYGFETNETITDVRLQPFVFYNGPISEDAKETLNISRVFGPKLLLGHGNKHPYRHIPPEVINNWMAIVDHYGVDAQYAPEFFEVVQDLLIMIVTYGYLNEGDDPNTANRKFNGRDLTREQFYAEFFRLIARYVPPVEVDRAQRW